MDHVSQTHCGDNIRRRLEKRNLAVSRSPFSLSHYQEEQQRTLLAANCLLFSGVQVSFGHPSSLLTKTAAAVAYVRGSDGWDGSRATDEGRYRYGEFKEKMVSVLFFENKADR